MSNNSSMPHSILTEFSKQFHFAFGVCIIPCVSFIGVLGNVLSMIVLSKQKPQKSSTIFVLALVVANTVYLFGSIKISVNFYTEIDGVFGFHYSRSVATFLYILMVSEYSIQFCGTYTSLFIPMCITIERILAVYFPFHFRRILTSRRVKCIVVLGFLLWTPQMAITLSLSRFEYNNDGVGVIQVVKSSKSVEDVYNVILKSYYVFVGPASVAIVLIGSFFIVIKIRKQGRVRKKMASSMTVFSTSAVSRVVTKIKAERQVTSKSLDLENMALHESAGQVVSDKDSNNTSVIEITEITATQNNFCTTEIDIKKIFLENKATLPKKSKQEKALSANETKQKKRSINRTTRSMLAINVFYSIANMFTFVCAYAMKETNNDTEIQQALGSCGEFFLSVNCALNFMAYVATNRNFRRDYWQLVKHCLKRK